MAYRESGDPPIYCGNFPYDATQREIERLFDRYGPLDRVDMKTGFAFVYMAERRDADDAIRSLDGKEFGQQRRRLRVEWSKGDGAIKQRETGRRAKLTPSTSLFIVNFDVERTRERDLEDHFRPYGRLKRVQMKRNYAFVEFEHQRDATEALESCNGGRFNGRTLTLEYVSATPDGRRVRSASPRRSSPRRSASPRYRASPRGRRSRGRSYSRSRSPSYTPSSRSGSSRSR